MISMTEQWAVQIDVTNCCHLKCSNCTRLLAHARKPFFMTVEEFARCVDALRDFPTESVPTNRVPQKMLGMIGGEPLLHPDFYEFCTILRDRGPARENCGLWTSLRWEEYRHAAIIRETFGYVHNNTHETECRHSPILVAIADAVNDPTERNRLIDACWLQSKWCGAVTPKGLFFCEVAAAFDMIFDGPGGLPVEPGCWRRPLEDFREQIDRWCQMCGLPLNLEGRLDKDEIDDISASNLKLLADSPAVKAGKYRLYNPAEHEATNEPWRYLG